MGYFSHHPHFPNMWGRVFLFRYVQSSTLGSLLNSNMRLNDTYLAINYVGLYASLGNTSPCWSRIWPYKIRPIKVPSEN